VKVTCWQENN